MYEVTLKAGFESMSLHLTPDPLAVIEATYKAEAHAEVGAFRGHSAPDEISRRRLLAFEKQLRDIGGSLTDVAELSGQAFKVRLILVSCNRNT